MRENADQNYSEYRNFLRSAGLFYTPWKHRKTTADFLMFSEDKVKDQWNNMG